MFDLEVQPREKLAYNLTTNGLILILFQTVMYTTWFYKSNKNGQIWPWPFTL